jgi:multidrug efflux pump subunit AcrA (membrane-fusion protein)
MWDAQYRVRVAEIELAAAQTSLEEAALVLEREEARLAEMTLLSPIDGVVVDVHKRGGEAVDEQTTVVTVIQPNPLWIDVSVRTRDALRLRAGQPAEVVWQDVDGVAAMGGRVTYISPAGHAGARQVKVRVEVANEIGLPTGLHATVRFLAPGGAGPAAADAGSAGGDGDEGGEALVGFFIPTSLPWEAQAGPESASNPP